MGTTAKPLGQPIALPAAQTLVYTAPANTRTSIDKCTVTNTTAGAINLSANIPSAASPAPGAGNSVMSIQPLPANTTYTCPEVVGHVLAAGDTVSFLASAVGLTLRMSGREFV